VVKTIFNDWALPRIKHKKNNEKNPLRKFKFPCPFFLSPFMITIFLCTVHFDFVTHRTTQALKTGYYVEPLQVWAVHVVWGCQLKQLRQRYIFAFVIQPQAHGTWISFPPPSFLYYPPFFQNFHNHSFFFIWEYQ